MRKNSVYPNAYARIRGGEEAPGISGKVEFYQTPKGVLVVARIFGLPKNSETGFFAFHIHEGFDCGGGGFLKTGSHYNPKNQIHPKHSGDLPPLLSCDGEAYMSVLTNRFNVREIIGRTVVIHDADDDYTTQPAGNAGTKIACGIIRIG